MTYICSQNMLNKYDGRGKIICRISKEQLIDTINREFGLRGTVTKLILI